MRAGSPLRRADQRDRLALVPAIDAEILAIHGNDAVLWEKLAHADQAEIGEIRRAIGIAIRQRRELREVIVAVKCHGDQPRINHAQHERHAAQMERRLGQHRLAGEERLGHSRRDPQRPSVVHIPRPRKGDQQPRVRDPLHLVEKPLRVERSLGPPFTQPASFMKACVPLTARAFSSCSRTIFPCDMPVLAAVSSSHSERSLLRRMLIV